jgi:hypothetical protein
MAVHILAIVDVSGPSPTITPIPNPAALVPVPGSLAGGIAADPTGRYAYFLVTFNVASRPGSQPCIASHERRRRRHDPCQCERRQSSHQPTIDVNLLTITNILRPLRRGPAPYA